MRLGFLRHADGSMSSSCRERETTAIGSSRITATWRFSTEALNCQGQVQEEHLEKTNEGCSQPPCPETRWSSTIIYSVNCWF
jgi:hypothetical protein